MMRFTPAGVAGSGKRSMTVAVRVDEESAQAIQVRSAITGAGPDGGDRSLASRVRALQSRSRPWLPELRPADGVLSKKLSDAAIPDLSNFKPAPLAQEPSRLVSHIALAHEEKPGVTPRTREALGEQSLDVATSYRLTRNLDVSAGLRYSQDRDRIAPAAEQAPQDSQAFYVGTQFRF